MKLFQYAIFWQPTEQQVKDGKKPILIQDIKSGLANDEKAIHLKAAKEIPEEYNDLLDQIQIAVRPF
jgi:hypothetical protein